MGAYFEPSPTGPYRGLLNRRLSPYSSLAHVEDLRARIREGGTLVAWRPLSVDPSQMPDDPYEDMDVDESAMEGLSDFLSGWLKSGPRTVLLIDYQSRPSHPGMQEQRSDWFAHGDDVFWILDSDFCARNDLQRFLSTQMGLWAGAAILLEGGDVRAYGIDVAWCNGSGSVLPRVRRTILHVVDRSRCVAGGAIGGAKAHLFRRRELSEISGAHRRCAAAGYRDGSAAG